MQASGKQPSLGRVHLALLSVQAKLHLRVLLVVRVLLGSVLTLTILKGTRIHQRPRDCLQL